MAIEAPPGLRLFIKAPTGETLRILSGRNRSGQILNVSLVDMLHGGVDTFEFQLEKNFVWPLGRNTQCHFYVDNVVWFVGYIEEVPLADQTDPVLLVQGKGFMHRLKQKNITATYASNTLEEIVKGIASAELGSDIDVFYNVAKITVPVLTGLQVEYKDKDLKFVFDQLVRIANFDYDNDKYRWYVDNDNELVFAQLDATPQKTLIEGYDYQNPEVAEDNTRIVNRLITFRTRQVAPKEAEFAKTYNDTISQSKFGVIEKKLTFADFLSIATIDKIADAILARRAPASVRIKTQFYQRKLDAPMEYGEYIVSNRRDEYFFLINDCDTLDGWDVSNLSLTTASLSMDHVLTGRQSIKIDTVDGSLGEYMEFTLDDAIPFPDIGRSFIYFTTFTPLIEVTYFDEKGNSYTIDFGKLTANLVANNPVVVDNLDSDPGPNNLVVDLLTGSIVNQWFRLEESLPAPQPNNDSFQVDDGGGLDDFEVVYATGPLTDTFDVNVLSTDGVLNVKKIRITFQTNAVTSFYLDRFDIFAKNFFGRRLQLESVEYSLDSQAIYANPAFGEPDDNVFAEINNKVEPGDVAYNIFSKQ